MANITFSNTAPAAYLISFVESFSYFENDNGIAHHYTILPDGLCDIVLFFDMENKLLDTQFYGIWNREIDVDVPANNNVLVISLYPTAAQYLLKFSIKSFLNNYRSVNDFNHLLDPTVSYPFNDIVEIFTKYFTGQLQQIDQRTIDLFCLIRERKGEIFISEIEKRLFWNQRQMNRYFNEWFGLSLKSYLNIIRCFATYSQVKQGDFKPSLSFTDQSHFSKELKKHTGNTPRQLFLKYNFPLQNSSLL